MRIRGLVIVASCLLVLARSGSAGLNENVLFSQRADVNGDGVIDISDPMFLNNYLFQSGDEPPCLDAADANDDGVLDISDTMTILNFLYSGGSSPPPHNWCGLDPTPDTLGCFQETCVE